MTNWKSATCEKCVFRVDDKCRRFPPALRGIIIHGENVDYPVTRMNSLACAEYTEEGQPTPFERAMTLAVDKWLNRPMPEPLTSNAGCVPLTTYDVAQEAWK